MRSRRRQRVINILSPVFKLCLAVYISKAMVSKFIELDRINTTFRNGPESISLRGLNSRNHVVPSPSCVRLEEVRYLISVRIQKTGTKRLFRRLKATAGSACDWTSCPCQNRQWHNEVAELIERHGESCSSSIRAMSCLLTCGRESPYIFWFDVPHADWKDYESGIKLAKAADPSSVLFTTNLREPVARVLSEFRHAKYEKYMWDYVVPDQSMSLMDFLRCDACKPGTENRQTRMLAGVGDRPWYEVYTSREAMLQQAKDNLAKTLWFGLYEKYEESIRLLEHALPDIADNMMETETNTNPSDSVNGLTKDNTSVYGLQFAEAVEEIRQKNSLDIQLYAYAIKLFEERLRRVSGMRKCDRQYSSISGLDKYKDEDACWTDLYNESLFVLRQTNGYETDFKFKMRSNSQKPRELKKNNYVLAFGAASVMGILSSNPYVFRLEAYLNMPVLPVGFGGGSPRQVEELLTRKGDEGQSVRELVAHSKYVIVEAMSGRSIENSLCQKPSIGLQEKCVTEDGKSIQGDDWWRQFAATSELGAYARLVNETRENWIQEHKKLIRLIRSLLNPQSKVIFLYVSKCEFKKKELGCFPQLVEKDWLAPVAEFADIHLEVISDASVPKTSSFALPNQSCRCWTRGDKICSYFPGMSRDCSCGFIENNYYPTDEEHSIIFEKLAQAIRLST